MVYFIAYIITWILLVLNVVNYVEYILRWIYLDTCQTSELEVIVLPIKGHYDDIEYSIRSTFILDSLNSKKYNLKIICLNLGMDNETQKICSLLSRDFSCLKIIDI